MHELRDLPSPTELSGKNKGVGTRSVARACCGFLGSDSVVGPEIVATACSEAVCRDWGFCPELLDSSIYTSILGSQI